MIEERRGEERMIEERRGEERRGGDIKYLLTAAVVSTGTRTI